MNRLNLVGESGATDFSSIMDEWKESAREMCEESERETMVKIRMHSCVNSRKQKLAYRVKDEEDEEKLDNADNGWTNVIDDEKAKLEKDVESLAWNEVCGGRKSKRVREKEGEQRMNRCKTVVAMNPLRKAKSFYRKKSHLAITDSDCTALIPPGYRCVKGKRYENDMGGCSKASLPALDDGRNGINSRNGGILSKSRKASKENGRNFRWSTNVQVGNLLEKSSLIPLETRELLKKSYREYYWKLESRKMASVKLANNADNVDNADNADNAGRDSAGERHECWKEDHLSECLTLRQCRLLSRMMNTAFRRDSVTSDKKVSLDFQRYSAGNVTSDARDSVVAKKIKRRRMKQVSKQLFGFRVVGTISKLFFSDNVDFVSIEFR